MTRAVFPGTFDPMHRGHLEIAIRASLIFDELVIAVYDAPPKKLLFSTEERLQLAGEALSDYQNISVVRYSGLTVDCARRNNAQVIVRGLRDVTDFTYEHQIGWAYSELAPDIELCYLFCRGDCASLSSTILKEVASLGGDVSQWATENVLRALRQKFNLPEPTVGSNQPSPSKGMTRTEGKFDRKG